MALLPADDPTTRLFLRHALATLAYRAAKAVRGASASFATFRATPDCNSPVELVAHMGDLMEWTRRMVDGEPRWTTATPLEWQEEVGRFFATLRALDDHLASGAPVRWEPGRVFQGGIADALTHVGQLAMLRRMAGQRMKSENYSRADIAVGRVGPDQVAADPGNEFD
jgi:hypothetical protein